MRDKAIVFQTGQGDSMICLSESMLIKPVFMIQLRADRVQDWLGMTLGTKAVDNALSIIQSGILDG
jgi:hypothetical protein